MKTHHPLYSVWIHMRERCNAVRCKAYKNYGGRGIRVCDEWSDFWGFVRDMSPRPAGGTLERKDNNGHYSASNCRWATHKEQNRNRRDNVLIEFNGETMCAAAWAERLGISNGAWHRRVKVYGPREAISRGGKISQRGWKKPRPKKSTHRCGHPKTGINCKVCRRIHHLVRIGRASLVNTAIHARN